MRDNDQILMEQLYTEAYSERDEMISVYSDLFKDLHDFRPRHIDWDSLTDAEVKERYNTLVTEYRMGLAKKQAFRDRNDESFEDELEMMRSRGAINDKQAIEWILDADRIDHSDYSEVESWISYQELTPNMRSKIIKTLGL